MKNEIYFKIIDERIERLGGDGNWMRYTKGHFFKNNYGLKNDEIYTIMWDKYTIPFIIMDKYDKIIDIENFIIKIKN